MKKLIGVSVIVAIILTAIAVVSPVGATSDDGLIFNAALFEPPGVENEILERGEVKVWNDGTVKVTFKVDREFADTVFYVFLEYGPLNLRASEQLGSVTTDQNGHAVAYFNLEDLEITFPNNFPTPGISVRTPLTPPPLVGFNTSFPNPYVD